MPFSEPPPPYIYIGEFTPNSPLAAVQDWQRHVDAGRIGARTPLSPDLLANLRATEALICRRPRKALW